MAEERVLALFDSKMVGPVKSIRHQALVAGTSNGFAGLMYPLPQARLMTVRYYPTVCLIVSRAR